MHAHTQNAHGPMLLLCIVFYTFNIYIKINITCDRQPLLRWMNNVSPQSPLNVYIFIYFGSTHKCNQYAFLVPFEWASQRTRSIHTHSFELPTKSIAVAVPLSHSVGASARTAKTRFRTHFFFFVFVSVDTYIGSFPAILHYSSAGADTAHHSYHLYYICRIIDV